MEETGLRKYKLHRMHAACYLHIDRPATYLLTQHLGGRLIENVWKLLGSHRKNKASLFRLHCLYLFYFWVVEIQFCWSSLDLDVDLQSSSIQYTEAAMHQALTTLTIYIVARI